MKLLLFVLLLLGPLSASAQAGSRGLIPPSSQLPFNSGAASGVRSAAHESANAWYAGSAHASLAGLRDQPGFSAGHLCRWTGITWKCGCADQECARSFWRFEASQEEPRSDSPACDTSHWNGTPCPPEPPRAYSLPVGAVRVSTSTELKDALANAAATDIVLADGTYDYSTYFHPNAAHRLWAEHLGGGVLKAGILFDEAPGSEVHGLKFDVADNGKTSNGAIVRTAGSGNRLTVTDSWFEGNKAVQWALLFNASDGIAVQRVVIRQFQRDGITVDSFPHFADPPPAISDVDIYWIRDPDPNCCRGTAEFGILLRAVTPGAVIERVKARWIDWSCFLPIDAKGAIWRDLDCDWSQQPFYFEHYVDNSLLERFWFGPHSGEGVTVESAQPNWHWRPSGQHIIIQDGQIESERYGIDTGVCNGDMLVQRVKFVGQCLAAINDSTHARFGAGHCTAGPNRFLSNDYSGLRAGAQAVTVNGPPFGGNLCGESWWHLYDQFP